MKCAEYQTPRDGAGKCCKCNRDMGIVFYSLDRKTFCGPTCREAYEFDSIAYALIDSIRLIEHLGGKACLQRKAIQLVGLEESNGKQG